MYKCIPCTNAQRKKTKVLSLAQGGKKSVFFLSQCTVTQKTAKYFHFCGEIEDREKWKIIKNLSLSARVQNFSRQLFHDSCYSLYSCCVLIQPPPHTHTHSLPLSSIYSCLYMLPHYPLFYLSFSLSLPYLSLSFIYIPLSPPTPSLLYLSLSLSPLPLNLSHLYLPPSITPSLSLPFSV